MFEAIVEDQGYVPQDECARFSTADEAKRYLIGLAKCAEEHAETEEEATDWCLFAEDLNLESGTWHAYCPNGDGYSVQKVRN